MNKAFLEEFELEENIQTASTSNPDQEQEHEYDSVFDESGSASEPSSAPANDGVDLTELQKLMRDNAEIQRNAVMQQQAQQAQQAQLQAQQLAQQQAQQAQQAQKAAREAAEQAILSRARYSVENPPTPAELQSLGAHANIIERMVAQNVAQFTESNLQPVVQALLEQNRRYEQELEALKPKQLTHQQLMDQQLLQRDPTIESIVQAPEFSRWLDTPVPGLVNQTYRNLANSTYQAGDVNGVLGVVEAFKSTLNGQKKDSITPKSNTGRPSVGTQKPRMLRYSELIEAKDKLNAGLMDRAKYDAILRKFDEKDAQGLVDYNR